MSAWTVQAGLKSIDRAYALIGPIDEPRDIRGVGARGQPGCSGSRPPTLRRFRDKLCAYETCLRSRREDPVALSGGFLLRTRLRRHTALHPDERPYEAGSDRDQALPEAMEQAAAGRATAAHGK